MGQLKWTRAAITSFLDADKYNYDTMDYGQGLAKNLLDYPIAPDDIVDDDALRDLWEELSLAQKAFEYQVARVEGYLEAKRHLS